MLHIFFLYHFSKMTFCLCLDPCVTYCPVCVPVSSHHAHQTAAFVGLGRLQVCDMGPFLATWWSFSDVTLRCDSHTVPAGCQRPLLECSHSPPWNAHLWSWGIFQPPPILQMLSETQFLPKQCPLCALDSNELLPLNPTAVPSFCHGYWRELENLRLKTPGQEGSTIGFR